MRAHLFELMNNIIFKADYETHVYLNGNNGITIKQLTDDINDPYQIISFASKARVMEVIKALRTLAKSATF